MVRYWHPDEFAALEKAAYGLGFESVAAGPLVRSSYHADKKTPARLPSGGPPQPPDRALRSEALQHRAIGPDREDRGRDRDPVLAGKVGALADVEGDQRRTVQAPAPLSHSQALPSKAGA